MCAVSASASSPMATWGLIRNVYRFGWLIPYLFGASPALCGSFLQGAGDGLPFQKLGRGRK